MLLNAIVPEGGQAMLCCEEELAGNDGCPTEGGGEGTVLYVDPGNEGHILHLLHNLPIHNLKCLLTANPLLSLVANQLLVLDSSSSQLRQMSNLLLIEGAVVE